MKTKIFLIALLAATFGWGFAELVEHADQSIRPENARLACQDWSGDGCSRRAIR